MPIDSLKTLSACLILISLIIGLYWYKKKLYFNFKNNGWALLRQIGSLNLGTRERIVVIEVSNRWLVIGVTAGRMVALAELDKPLPTGDANSESTSRHDASFQSVVKTFALKQ